MKFKKPEKYSALDGKTKVRFESECGKLMLLASPSGVSITGQNVDFHTMSDLQDFAKCMSDAWVEHQKLRPKLTADIPKGLKL